MKKVVNISLGPNTDNYELKGKFLGHNFHIRRFGTNGNLDKAEDLLLQMKDTACRLKQHMPALLKPLCWPLRDALNPLPWAATPNGKK